jgi:hypothetical protein
MSNYLATFLDKDKASKQPDVLTAIRIFILLKSKRSFIVFSKLAECDKEVTGIELLGMIPNSKKLKTYDDEIKRDLAEELNARNRYSALNVILLNLTEAKLVTRRNVGATFFYEINKETYALVEQFVSNLHDIKRSERSKTKPAKG